MGSLDLIFGLEILGHFKKFIILRIHLQIYINHLQCSTDSSSVNNSSRAS